MTPLRFATILTFVSALTGALAPAPARADEPTKRIAVLVLGSGGLASETAESLTEVLIAALLARRSVEVVGKEELQAQLGTDERSSQSCIDSAACLGRVGVELGVDEVVVGTVGPKRGGGGFTMSVSRIEIATARSLARVFRTVDGDEQALVGAIQQAAAEVSEDAAAPGLLRVMSEPDGAQVYLDDEPHGSTPLTLREVPAGVHRVRIERAGHRPWTGTVEVRSGGQFEVGARLDPAPETAPRRTAPSVAGIILVSAGATLAVGGGLAGYVFGSASQEEPGAGSQVDIARDLDGNEGQALLANVSFAVAGAAALFTTYLIVFESDWVFGGEAPAAATAGVVPVPGGAVIAAGASF